MLASMVHAQSQTRRCDVTVHGRGAGPLTRPRHVASVEDVIPNVVVGRSWKLSPHQAEAPHQAILITAALSEDIEFRFPYWSFHVVSVNSRPATRPNDSTFRLV